MTITSQTNVVTAQGNGVTTTFSYNFLMPDASDAVIIFTNAAGSQTTLTPTQYTITGIGNSAGGTVTYPIGGPSPIASGTTLTIARILPLVQETSISNQGAFYPQAIESALDYEMMVSQQIENTSQHALVTPIVDPAVPLPIPAAAQRANQILGFDGVGNPIAAQPSSALVSSVMQPVVSAASLAIARTALGLGTAATENLGTVIVDDGAGHLTIGTNEVTPLMEVGAFTSIVSAATTDLGSIVSNNINITGTNTITSFGSSAAATAPLYFLTFAAALTISYNATVMVLPGAVSITTAPGASAIVQYLGSGNWRMLAFFAPAVVYTGSAPTRQTVLSGPLSAGVPSFLPSSSGSRSLTTTGITTSAPLVVTAAAGFGAGGAIDFFAELTSNVTWSTITASSTVYLGLTMSAGVLTTFFTTLAPIYQAVGSISTTNGQYTFDFTQMKMFLGNGSTAPAVTAVFVGECVTSSSAVTSATEYAYGGRYDSGWIAPLPGVGVQTILNSNLGVSDATASLVIMNTTTEGGYLPGDIFYPIGTANVSGNVVPMPTSHNRNTAWFTTGAFAAFNLLNKTTGVALTATAADWSYRFTIRRSW